MEPAERARSRPRRDRLRGPRLPLTGTPFAPGFTPPTAGSPVQPLAGAAQAVVGNPKRTAGELGATVAAAVFAGTSPRPSLIADQGITLAEGVRTFPVPGNSFGRSREGDYAYNLFVNMDPAYARVTSIAAILRVRTPVVDTETFTEEYFAGLDTQVVPLPGAAVLLASGLAGMGLHRRRQRKAGMTTIPASPARQQPRSPKRALKRGKAA